MPTIRVNGAELHYRDDGAGPQTIVFAHGLLWSGWMFDEQVAALADRYRCVRLDFRGQGQSQITRSGYDMETLYADAVGLIAALGLAPCHFLGLSMGGFVGMRIGARRPELLRSLVLMETSADPEPSENIPRYRTLSWVARCFGLAPVAGQVMPIMFGEKFLADASRAALRADCRRRLLENDRVGITRAVRGVIEREGVYDEIGRITLPTLVMVGDQDTATTPAKARRIHERIQGSKLVIIPGAGHTSSVEEPAFVNRALESFLGGCRDLAQILEE